MAKEHTRYTEAFENIRDVVLTHAGEEARADLDLIESILPAEGRVYMLTDGCMWEKNYQEGTRHPHSVEVADAATGQMRYIRSGAKIVLIEGDVTELRTQEGYNERQKAHENDKGRA